MERSKHNPSEALLQKRVSPAAAGLVLLAMAALLCGWNFAAAAWGFSLPL